MAAAGRELFLCFEKFAKYEGEIECIALFICSIFPRLILFEGRLAREKKVDKGNVGLEGARCCLLYT